MLHDHTWKNDFARLAMDYYQEADADGAEEHKKAALAMACNNDEAVQLYHIWNASFCAEGQDEECHLLWQAAFEGALITWARSHDLDEDAAWDLWNEICDWGGC